MNVYQCQRLNTYSDLILHQTWLAQNYQFSICLTVSHWPILVLCLFGGKDGAMVATWIHILFSIVLMCRLLELGFCASYLKSITFSRSASKPQHNLVLVVRVWSSQCWSTVDSSPKGLWPPFLLAIFFSHGSEDCDGDLAHLQQLVAHQRRFRTSTLHPGQPLSSCSYLSIAPCPWPSSVLQHHKTLIEDIWLYNKWFWCRF